jgi:hypothetical protein
MFGIDRRIVEKITFVNVVEFGEAETFESVRQGGCLKLSKVTRLHRTTSPNRALR